MPNKKINTHKIRKILRLRFEAGLFFRQISRYTGRQYRYCPENVQTS